MSIPKHDEIRVPALQLIAERKRVTLREFEQPLAKHFGLTEEDLATTYPANDTRVFNDRISWALSHLNLAGLLHKPKRAVFELSPLGIEKLQTPQTVNDFVDGVIKEQRTKKAATDEAQNDVADVLPTPTEDRDLSVLTPREELEESALRIREAHYQEIIDTVLSKTPRAFESLVVKLLQKMGYGGKIKQSETVTPYSNDGGIDGIIKEDILGFGRIYIQAKRYAPHKSVGSSEVRNFVGALASASSSKGVFITTSSFTRSALAYAENLPSNINLVLMDGEQLAKYLYDYGLGVQVEQIIEIKQLDGEFWDEMENDEP